MRALLVVGIAVLAGIAGFALALRMHPAEGANLPGAGFAAIPGEVGGQDIFGAYDVVKGWPKDLSTLPGHEKWTWSAAEGVYAENPNRVFYVNLGELPNIKRPETHLLKDLGPNILFPTGRLPWRDATFATLPGGGAAGADPADGMKLWRGQKPPYREVGVDARWEDCINVIDANGNIVEQWTQWDKILKRPHYITINPYDPDKNVWLVDDHMEVIYKFSHDGKQLLQTIGTPGVAGADATHFNRPTFIAFQPDSSMYVADGYNGHRVAKFDKDGKFLLDWGKAGVAPNEKRPGYFTNVHGVAVDPQTRHVFVNDRYNHRVQIFDENGKYLKEFYVGDAPSDVHLLYIGADRTLWMPDRGTSKMLKYDLDGHFLYSWGTWGDQPGEFWGVHGISVDQEGNFYVAEVDSGRIQKFRPRPGVNPEFLVSKPVYAAWK
jgi:sugar lactone lactonase YvrE